MKDGKICVAVEKERVTRIKHDGGNDTRAIQYCLDAEGITLDDVSVVVQNSNFGFFEFGNGYYNGPRLFAESKVPVVTISHHLAHAYYALGSSPFHEASILVVDGCGSLMDEVMDHSDTTYVTESVRPELRHLYAEKDSYYHFDGTKVTTLYKDYSPLGKVLKQYPMHPPTTLDSIGGVYSAASNYCFGDSSDLGKLMGLAPYGRPGIYDFEVFKLKEGRVYVNYDWMLAFTKPVLSYNDLFGNFQYYADIAYWVQRETERAVLYLIDSRFDHHRSANLLFTGGVALNAVANARIVRESKFKHAYFTPAAGDNGLAIGCAYYGWMEWLKQERVVHTGRSNFGVCYPNPKVKEVLDTFFIPSTKNVQMVLDVFIKAMVESGGCIPAPDTYKIQFFIIEAGVHSFVLSNGKCTYANEMVASPDCTVMLDGVSLIRSINDPDSFFYYDGAATIKGDIAPFLKLTKDSGLKSRMRSLVGKDQQACVVRYVQLEDVAKATAHLLSKGKVLGWFQEGCEFGPRALGFRSIIADPRKEGVRDFINAKIKFREEFRPFAPSVLREDVSQYFEYEGESPYMIQVAQVTETWKKQLQSVMHRDNSSRIQTVSSDWSKKYYNLLKEFKALTGLSVILNTSFNKKGMPIVETPEQALNFFYDCSLDGVVIGDYLIEK